MVFRSSSFRIFQEQHKSFNVYNFYFLKHVKSIVCSRPAAKFLCSSLQNKINSSKNLKCKTAQTLTYFRLANRQASCTSSLVSNKQDCLKLPASLKSVHRLKASSLQDCQFRLLSSAAVPPANTLQLRLSVGVWEEFPAGLDYSIDYIDSRPAAPASTPVVLLSHGSPGHHSSLGRLLTLLHEQGYRVISPTFPGYAGSQAASAEHANCFTHSPGENAAFVLTLLEHLQVQRVHVAVGFSFGCPPLRLLAGLLNRVDAVIMCAPTTHESNRLQQPYWLLQRLSFLYDKPYMRPALSLVLRIAYQVLGIPSSSQRERVAILRHAANADYDMVASNIIQLLHRKCPVRLLIPSLDDRISQESFSQYARLYNQPAKAEVTEYGFKSCGVPELEGAVRLYQLTECNHFLFKAPWVSDLVLDLVKEILQEPTVEKNVT